MKEWFIKSDRTKHIPPKFFSFSQELKKDKKINIQYIRSSDNMVDLFTRHFPLQLSESLFVILGCIICETYEEELLMSTWGGAYVAALFFSYYGFVPQGFPGKVFNDAV